MMMQMLAACGLEIMTDNVREADSDNPRGYYELEQVKKIAEDASWLIDARGKVVKMISMLLNHLPIDHEYKIVFMLRDIEEILTSQDKMMSRLNTQGARLDREQLADVYRRHLAQVQDWLEQQPNIDVLYLEYGDIIARPEEAASDLLDFLDRPMPVDAIAAAVDDSLYRNRNAGTS